VMYAWFRKWLQGVEADLTPEPDKIEPVAFERIVCFPDKPYNQGMSEKYENVPSLAFRRGQQVVESNPLPILSKDSWNQRRTEMLQRLEECLGGFPHEKHPKVTQFSVDSGEKLGIETLNIETEPGISVPVVIARQSQTDKKNRHCLLWLDSKGKAVAFESPEVRSILEQGFTVAMPDLRGIGETAWSRSALSDVWDYQLFQNGMILGRPILGMWVWDVLQCVQVLRERDESLTLVGHGVFGLVALLCSAYDEQIAGTVCHKSLASYLYPDGFSSVHPLSTFVPNILKVADVPILSAMVSPRGLYLSGLIEGGGNTLSDDQLKDLFAVPRKVFETFGAGDRLILTSAPNELLSEPLIKWIGSLF
jgi:hypothetical protein